LAEQIPLPFERRSALTRADFQSSPANAPALAFVDAWPGWQIAAAALHGPPGSGKSHLVAIWQAASNAQIVPARELVRAAGAIDPMRPVAIEDFDAAHVSMARDAALFALLEHARPSAPVLLTGREPPSQWKTVLPDLASRFSAILAFPLWAPDDALLASIARKLFDDRQLHVPEPVIEKMIRSLERSPAAIRDFVERADQKALAEGRPINLALVREMLRLGTSERIEPEDPKED